MPVAKINVICGESDTKSLQKRLQESCFCPLTVHSICACTVPSVVNVHGAQGYGACAQLIVTGA